MLPRKQSERLLARQERERIGNMNAEAWRSRDHKARKLGIEPEPWVRRTERRQAPTAVSVLAILFD